ncbi:hypothetical protein F5888DRAFT_1855317 [Russula emetica]|nr:hypothetical protein F5888DRAFT_1855317 [Russula emetica]
MSRTAVSPPTSPPHSPPSLSGPSSSIQSHRVQHRRGSTSAGDPWGNHLELNMNPSRTTTCKLTIVRVNPTPPIQLDEQPPSPQHRRHVGFGAHSQNTHRRLGSHGTGKGENTRMSFASGSFAPPGSSSGPGRQSGSPTHGHGHSLHRRPSAPKPRLSADQLVSLAQQSCHPQSAPASPRTPGGSLTATSGSGRNSFTAIPDDVFLPFVDRTQEVWALFTSPQPGARLLALLAQTFPSKSVPESPVTDESVFETDPRQWSFAQLDYWVKQVDRDVAPDELWVGLIRRCVLYRSELIWERIKGALGAPPELDPDGFERDPYTVDDPLIFKNLKLDHSSDPGTRFTESPIQDFHAEPQPTPDHVSESNVSVPAGGSPDISALSIEPVLVTTSPTAEHDHPPTRPGGHRMHDISEDVREESEQNEGDATPTAEPVSSSPPPRGIIQGLCISTGPALPGLFATESGQIVPTSLSRTSSVSSIAQHQSTQVASSPPKRRWTYAASNASSEAYDMAGERGPGNPLFPTNFARLALGPTLTANNPALRSHDFPPQPAFSNPHAIREGILRGRRGKPSWADGWDPMKHEYAITASEGSGGGH